MQLHELKNVNGAVYGKKRVDCGKGCGHDQTYGCGLKGRSELRSIKSKFLSASTARSLLVSSLALLCGFVVVGRYEAADEISLSLAFKMDKVSGTVSEWKNAQGHRNLVRDTISSSFVRHSSHQ